MAVCTECGGCPDIFSVEYLNARCGREGEVEFFRRGDSGLPTVRLTNSFGSAEICLYGAHVLGWQPAGQSKPVVWLSEKALFQPGKAIRGGIPVCWPWFGACGFNKANPSHGFARLSFWNVQAVTLMTDGRTAITLALQDSEKTRAFWPHAFSARLTVTLGWELDVALETTNTGDQPWRASGALHTYFGVGDIGAVTVTGLEGCRYDDTAGSIPADRLQEGPIRVDAETDRFYRDTAATVVIDDPSLGRKIRVAKANSLSTVVWNPWKEKAAKLADFGDEEYRTMLCVEAVNAGDDEILLPPGASQTLRQTISLDEK